MARIQINVDQIVSESGRKQKYMIGKVSGVQVLGISNEVKPTVQEIVKTMKEAKSAALKGIQAHLKYAETVKAIEGMDKGPKRDKLIVKRKELKASATSSIKQVKFLLSASNRSLRSLGLGGLSLPMSVDMIKVEGKAAVKAMATIKAVVVTEFGVTGKRGKFKPKFIKPELLENAGEVKTATKARKPASAKKEEEPAPKTARPKTTGGKGAPRVQHDTQFPPTPKALSLIKTIIEKDGVTRGKIVAKGDAVDYIHGTGNFRIRKEGDKYKLYANFGGNGGASGYAMPEATARKGLRKAIKNLSKFEKPNRIQAQQAWGQAQLG